MVKAKRLRGPQKKAYTAEYDGFFFMYIYQRIPSMAFLTYYKSTCATRGYLRRLPSSAVRAAMRVCVLLEAAFVGYEDRYEGG